MAITIAGAQLSTRKPKDLDAALIASTGYNAAENLRIISGSPLAGRLAAALMPFLGDDAPPLGELAVRIEKDQAVATSTVAADIRKLFSNADVSTDETDTSAQQVSE